jgi:hypothetical protein
MISMPETDFQDMEGGHSTQLEELIMCRGQSAYGQQPGANTLINGSEFDFGMPLDETNLSAFYGTSFALMS